ncbi:hypothetical protein [Anaeromyxobacter sp. SG66]|uniref:hypothetical protein n=1 Tax=Anaeromyxobacter sp. SG66 TaxID=2925410 RepID=UPI001F586307|nr:hypothetical protein [Anaeromyxobacter sp. SG66]
MEPQGTTAPPRQRWLSRVDLSIFLVSLAVVNAPALVPYFPAGDLHSHVYNAWLASLVERGEAPGLWLAPGWTNRLVDVPLEGLLLVLSPRGAERVVLVVLANLFFGSAFLFVRNVSGRRCWEWLPALAVLTVGWAFQTGLSNWFASAALSLLAVGLLSGARVHARRLVAGLLILALAAIGNPLPAAWGLATGAIVWLLRRPGLRPVPIVVASAGGALAVGAAVVASGIGAYRSGQLLAFSGADQLWVFDAKYALFTLLLAAVLAWAIRDAQREGALAGPAIAVALFSAACAAGTPDTLLFPGYEVPAFYLSRRASLLAGVGWIAVAAQARFSPRRLAMLCAVAGSWTALVLVDWARLSAFHEAMDAAVHDVPAGGRVVATVFGPGRYPLHRSLDLACTGRCFAWGNYEAPTRAFRMRASAENPFVIGTTDAFLAFDAGAYRVPPPPLELWKIGPCRRGGPDARLCASRATPGEVLVPSCVDPFVRLVGSGNVDRCASDLDRARP